MMDARLHCPFVMQVVGPSQSGKSSFVGRLLVESEQLFDRPIDHVTWYSPHGQLPRELANAASGLPFQLEVKTGQSELDILNEDFGGGGGDGQHRVVVIDDFASELKNSTALTNLYTKGSHHQGVTVIQILQTLFLQSKEARTRSLNIHYLVLMRQTRDVSQVRHLANQVTTTTAEGQAFMQAYRDAVNQRPYAYLMLTFHPAAPRELFLRTNLFRGETPPHMVYVIGGGGGK